MAKIEKIIKKNAQMQEMCSIVGIDLIITVTTFLSDEIRLIILKGRMILAIRITRTVL